jgi:hypothetical protein
MSQSVNEPGQQPNTTGQAPDGNNQGHPAWQEILDALPESLHPLITPKLQEWDKGVNDKINQVRTQYDPYKTFVEEKIDPALLQQAVQLIAAIDEDPEAVAKELIESFELDYVLKSAAQQQVVQQQQQQTSDDDDIFGNNVPDVTKLPQFVELQNALTEVQGKLNKQEETSQQEEARKAHETALEALKKDPVTGQDREFDPMFVTALMSQGASGEAAVQQYQSIVNQAAAQIAGTSQQQVTQQPPVVMGGDGTTGSGIPEGGVNMGSMKRNDVNQMVANLIANAQSQET